MQHIIEVENIKCGGCVNSITKSLLEIPGITDVKIDAETQHVTVASGEETDRNVIVEKLAGLGYPEAGNNDLLHKAKSYVSCAIGRMG